MKITGHLKEQIVSLDNLYDAFHKASKGKCRKQEVLEFSANFDDNIRLLRERLIDGTVSIGTAKILKVKKRTNVSRV